MLGLLTAAAIGVGSIAYAPVAANAQQTICDKNGYVKQGSKGLSLPGSTGEVIRLWWYKNSSNKWCAYTELRGVYYNTSTKWRIGVALKDAHGNTLIVDEGNWTQYAGPVEWQSPAYAEGWVYWGGVRKPVDSR